MDSFRRSPSREDYITEFLQGPLGDLAQRCIIFNDQNRLESPRGVLNHIYRSFLIGDLVDARKIDLERRANTQFTANTDGSATLLHHSINSSQPQASASAKRLGCEKGLEYVCL